MNKDGIPASIYEDNTAFWQKQVKTVNEMLIERMKGEVTLLTIGRRK